MERAEPKDRFTRVTCLMLFSERELAFTIAICYNVKKLSSLKRLVRTTVAMSHN